jgi:hypothetical protein
MVDNAIFGRRRVRVSRSVLWSCVGAPRQAVYPAGPMRWSQGKRPARLRRQQTPLPQSYLSMEGVQSGSAVNRELQVVREHAHLFDQLLDQNPAFLDLSSHPPPRCRGLGGSPPPFKTLLQIALHPILDLPFSLVASRLDGRSEPIFLFVERFGADLVLHNAAPTTCAARLTTPPPSPHVLPIGSGGPFRVPAGPWQPRCVRIAACRRARHDRAASSPAQRDERAPILPRRLTYPCPG